MYKIGICDDDKILCAVLEVLIRSVKQKSSADTDFG